MEITVSISERLKYARTRSALTLTQVKERTGIGESSISEFENCKREPSLSQLQALANVYRRSVAFFLAEGVIAPETVLWREKPKDRCEEVESVFLKLHEQYHNLEMWAEEELPVCLPMVSCSTDPWNYMKSEGLAAKVRNVLSLGDRPGLSLLSVLEEVCGVKIFHLNFEPSGTAASTFSESYGAAMLLNAGNVRWRRNFDLAHELFHLLTWPLFRKGGDEASSFAASDSEEKYANVFASNLLLPAEAVRTACSNKLRDGKLGYPEIYDIARQFDVSAEALLWRLFNLKLFADNIRKEQVREFAQNITAMSAVYEERRDTEAPKWPERYTILAIKALRAGAMSVGRFSEYMEVSRHTAMKYIQQETMDGQEVPLAVA